MKRKVLYSVVLAFIICNVNAQWAPWVKLNDPPGDHAKALLSIGTDLYAGTDSGIFLSTDSADTWISKNNGLTSSNVMALVSSGSAIIAGTRGGIFKSINNGTNWSKVFDGDVWGVAVKGDNIFAALYNEGIYLSTDNGTQWTLMNPGPINQSHLTYHLASSGNYFCAENYLGQQYKLTNDIYHWDEINGISEYELFSIANDSSVLYVGTQKGVYRSKVGFALWLAEFEGFGSSKVLSLAITGKNLYAGTEIGLYKIPLSAMSLGIEDLKTDDLMVKIYPNPISVQTTFMLNKDIKYASLIICDIHGREVIKTSFSGTQVVFVRGNLKSSIYFYQIKNENDIFKTGKIIIE